MCLVPILFLLVVTLVRRLSLPSRASLPLSAALMLVIRLAYLAADPREVMSSAVGGCLEALVPLSVVFGAISLFQTMQHTKVRAAPLAGPPLAPHAPSGALSRPLVAKRHAMQRWFLHARGCTTVAAAAAAPTPAQPELPRPPVMRLRAADAQSTPTHARAHARTHPRTHAMRARLRSAFHSSCST